MAVSEAALSQILADAKERNLLKFSERNKWRTYVTEVNLGHINRPYISFPTTRI